jgi:Flp pilus assembly protein TadG
MEFVADLASGGVAGGAAVCLAAAVALAWSIRWLRRLGRLLHAAQVAAARPAPDGQSGLATVEFALVFPFALMALLLVVQTALMVQANIVVNYAASCGVRAAVVWIPRPISTGAIVTDPNAASDTANWISSDSVLSPKFFRIQSAAALACWPISGQFSVEFTQNAAGSNPAAVMTVGQALQLMHQVPGSQHTFNRFSDDDWLSKYLYSVMNTRVRVQRVAPVLPFRPHGNYGADDLVQVDVEHDFSLRIPFAQRVLGRRKATVGLFNLTLGDEDRLYTTTIRGSATLSNEGRTEFPPGIVGR